MGTLAAQANVRALKQSALRLGSNRFFYYYFFLFFFIFCNQHSDVNQLQMVRNKGGDGQMSPIYPVRERNCTKQKFAFEVLELCGGKLI